MAQMRIDKIVSTMGEWSRSEVKRLIKDGRISADGVVVPAPEFKCDPDKSSITVDGNPLNYSEFVYIMLHKPAGVLSATEDKRQQTVLDLLPQELRRRDLYPVGRLDKDTEGLLLITDDGALGHSLLSPKHHVDKLYYAETEGEITEADCRAFEEGIVLGDGLECMSAGLEIIKSGEESEVLVTLHEGKFHQVKRMLASRGAPVTYLKRLKMGTLSLDEALDKGEWRYLTDEEIGELKNASK